MIGTMLFPWVCEILQTDVMPKTTQWPVASITSFDLITFSSTRCLFCVVLGQVSGLQVGAIKPCSPGHLIEGNGKSYITSPVLLLSWFSV